MKTWKHRVGMLAGILATQLLSAAEARTNATPPRATVAVMQWRPMEPPLMRPEDSHWHFTFRRLVSSELLQIAGLRVVPEESVTREMTRQNRDEPGNTNAVAGIRSLAESVRARWVVVGFLTRTGASWTVDAKTVDALSGEFGKRVSATSTNWFELRDQVVRQVLQRMDITPSPEEQQRLAKPWTTSPRALEWASQAMSLPERDWVQRAELCRKALAEDPQFVQARGLLATALYNLGRDDEALVEARRALGEQPDAYSAGRLHCLVATVLVRKEQTDEAAREAAQGLQVTPENIELLEMQASLCEFRGDLQSASDSLRRAVDCDPNNPSLYASLGRIQSKQGNLTNALANLNRAAQLAVNTSGMEQMEVDRVLANSYETLGNLTNALRHYRSFLSKGRDFGFPESKMTWAQESVRKLEQRSQPMSVAVGRTKEYSAPDLQAALLERLSPEQMAKAVNPIASTPEMASWAGKIVAGTQGDLARARKLFDEMASRPKAAGGATRTAQEVFAAWADLGQSFCCQEYAKLFVALARSARLPAFYVHVERDYAGTMVDHDCAVVFAEDKAWLVDPAYAWFGVPHQEYRVLDDLQTIAHHAFQPHDGKVDVSLCRAGLKLDPDFVWGRMHLVMALIEAEKYEEARQELDAAREQAPENWRGYQLEGMLDFKQDRLEEAHKWFQKTVEANRADGNTRVMLAQVLFRSGQQAAAQQELLAGLRRPHSPQNEEVARELLALLGEALGSESNLPNASQFPVDAASYCDLGTSFLSGSKPNYVEAAKWFRKAAEMDHPKAQCILGVLYSHGWGVPQDPAVAIAWFKKAAEGGDAEAMRNLGVAYGKGMGVKRSLEEGACWLRRAAEAGDAKSQTLLGRASYEGMGVPKDLAEAIFWLTLAADESAAASGVSVIMAENQRETGPREAQALLKEVKLFASPEELAKAKARLDSFKVRRSAASGAKEALPTPAPTAPKSDSNGP